MKINLPCLIIARRYFIAIKLGYLKPESRNLLQLFVAERNAPRFKTSQELIQYCVGTFAWGVHDSHSTLQ
jgi:hypothetical protein